MIKCSKNIRNSCIVIMLCFFSLFVEIRKEKKCYQAHVMNLLQIYFGKCEYHGFNMLQEHDNNIFKEC